MIDSNDTVFKYNKKANMYSMIEADYLMENNMESRNLFLFLSNDEGDNYFCRSFFPEEKIDLSTGIEKVLYNRINNFLQPFELTIVRCFFINESCKQQEKCKTVIVILKMKNVNTFRVIKWKKRQILTASFVTVR